MTSTTLLIGRMPALTSRCAIHDGDGPIVTSRDPTEVAGTAVGRVDADRDVGADRGVRGSVGFGDLEREPEVCGDFARDAHDAHGVGSVRGDRQVEDHVVEPEQTAHVSAGLGGGVEVDDPLVIVAEAELVGSEEHAVGGDAPDRPAFEDPERLREMRAGRGVRDDVAGGDVLRAAHDPGRAISEVDIDEGQLVGLGMLHDIDDARRDHPARRRGRARRHPRPPGRPG